uniref:Alpha/beta hydrolase fold-3 domain-containing protein n=1 Tax=Kalanchoe fedtschenkoi TaxID=63787 RepID=A0A7N0V0X5_KALFE
MGSSSSGESGQLLSSPRIPWKVRLFLSVSTFFVDLSCRPNHTFNRALFNLVDRKSPAGTTARRVRSSDVTVDPATRLWFRLFVPETASRVGLPVVIYFHGGGFVCMSANSRPYHDLCARLAYELDAVVVSVNYRLAAEHKCPAQYEDAERVLAFLAGRGSDVLPPKADLSKCFLAGDSAGANIAHHLTVRASKMRDESKVNILGVVAIQAFFFGEERTGSETALRNLPVVNMKRTDWTCRAFLPEGADLDHPAINVIRALGDAGSVEYPATMVVVGGFDPLKDRQKMYYRALKALGKEAYLVEYDNAFHTFYAFPEVPESAAMIAEIRDFMKAQMEKQDFSVNADE